MIDNGSVDFTLSCYRRLLSALDAAGYEFHPVRDAFARNAPGKRVYLRHDVDSLPQNSLAMARIEEELRIRATYYFRAVPCSWDAPVIEEISSMGHEIGYHYESLTTCRGDVDAAYEDFKTNLAQMRRIAEVDTVCMHGSPRSRFDSRDMWMRYDYRESGITGEPYFDIDWSGVFYLTDTGRRWDGFRFSVRDKIPHWQDVWTERGLVFHSSSEIIERVDELPDEIVMTTHPQRWSDEWMPWLWELLSQSVKNVVKLALIHFK